jgi:hypothetical protein
MLSPPERAAEDLRAWAAKAGVEQAILVEDGFSAVRLPSGAGAPEPAYRAPCGSLLRGHRLFSRRAAEQPRVQARRRLLLQTGQHVAVCVQCDAHARMAQALGDHLRMLALLEQQRRVAVAQVVKPDGRQRLGQGLLGDESLEIPAGNPGRVARNSGPKSWYACPRGRVPAGGSGDGRAAHGAPAPACTHKLRLLDFRHRGPRGRPPPGHAATRGVAAIHGLTPPRGGGAGATCKAAPVRPRHAWRADRMASRRGCSRSSRRGTLRFLSTRGTRRPPCAISSGWQSGRGRGGAPRGLGSHRRRGGWLDDVATPSPAGRKSR